jgi:hypothetical protein
VSLAPLSAGETYTPKPTGPWVCSTCGETIHGYRPEEDVCGRCELHAIKLGLGQVVGPRVAPMPPPVEGAGP